jgi:hypothetical protein
VRNSTPEAQDWPFEDILRRDPKLRQTIDWIVNEDTFTLSVRLGAATEWIPLPRSSSLSWATQLISRSPCTTMRSDRKVESVMQDLIEWHPGCISLTGVS